MTVDNYCKMIYFLLNLEIQRKYQVFNSGMEASVDSNGIALVSMAAIEDEVHMRLL